MMDNKHQSVSGNGSGQKCSPQKLNGTYTQEYNQQNESRLHSGDNDFVTIKN
jgi:hypothetical protein